MAMQDGRGECECCGEERVLSDGLCRWYGELYRCIQCGEVFSRVGDVLVRVVPPEFDLEGARRARNRVVRRECSFVDEYGECCVACGRLEIDCECNDGPLVV
jgi:hypothetical protein